MTPTLSTLGHVAACPGSISLPWAVREGHRAPTLGRAIHRLLQYMASGETPAHVGELAAMFGLDAADVGRLAFLAEHLRLPVPPGALAEVPLGYWPDGSVRRFTDEEMAEARRRGLRYPELGQILSGTIDVMWAEPWPFRVFSRGSVPYEVECHHPNHTLWVTDYKGGSEEHVPPVDRNWQLRGAAVLAARWTGAQRVIPAICYVNAAECAEAVRASQIYAGRWEVGAPLDAAALDAVEQEMRAVLARARGEGDGLCVDAVGDAAPKGGQGRGCVSVRGDGAQAEPHPVPPLILGPHCDHCPARGACPALAAEAVTLLGALEERDDVHREVDEGGPGAVPRGRGCGGLQLRVGRDTAEGAAVQDGGSGALLRGESCPGVARGEGGEGAAPQAATALTPARAAHLAGIIPALRRILDAAEVAVRAHVHAAGAPLVLADGREYGPALEEVRSYRTRPTYEALAAAVGDVAADEAFVATADRLKAALRGDRARLPQGAWAAFEEELEARGAVVVGAREVWRTRWPAKPAEVDDGRAGSGAPVAHAAPMVPGARAVDVPPRVRDEAPPDGGSGVAAPGPADGGPARALDGGRPAVSRAPCSVCKRDRRVTRTGVVVPHQAPGSALRCGGTGHPPAEPLQLHVAP